MMASSSASETTFNNYTFSHQWTVNHLGARLCHPGEIKSATFDSPEGAKPATKWRLVLYKEQVHRQLGASTPSEENQYISLNLNRLIQTQPSKIKKKKEVPTIQGDFLSSSPVMTLFAAAQQIQPQAEHLYEESKVWVEAHLKGPTIIYREKRKDVASQGNPGPKQVPFKIWKQTYNYSDKNETNLTVYVAATFNRCLSMSKLRDSLRTTFDLEIQVWLLDDPVHVHRPIHVPEFNLGKLMEDNRRKNIFTDITLVAADKKEFKAHKLILAAQSDFFKTRFSSRWQDQKSAESSDKVELTDVPCNVMEVMLSYMYTGEVAAIEEVAISVLPFAEEYGLEGLRKMCEQSLAESLTSDNAVDLLITANAHNALDLKKVSMDYISSNAVSVRKSEGWRKLKERQDCHDLCIELLERSLKSLNGNS